MITDTAGIVAGPGCSGGGTVVTCPDPMGTTVRVLVAPADGADRVVIDLALPSFLNGGSARGRAGRRAVRGGSVARGGRRLLVCDGRQDSVNGGAGSDRARVDGKDRVRNVEQLG